MSRNYDRIAAIYDLLGAIYSGGAIARSKQEHLRWLRRGQTVLYAGAGTSAECAKAAAVGAEVTVCDTSERMLARARRRFEAEELDGHFERSDALRLPGAFDVVVAPYFLNVLGPRQLGAAIASLAQRVKPGGSLVTVDFRGPRGRLPFRLLQRVYYLFPQLLFLLLTRNPWHELYDYSKVAHAAAPELEPTERICTRVFGLPLLETIRFEKRIS